MIKGRLISVARRQEDLTTSSWFAWQGFDVWIASREHGLQIGRDGGPDRRVREPIINLDLSPEFLLSIIGKGRYHRVGEKFEHGVRLSQADTGTVDLVSGMDAQRDGPDRHNLQSVHFSYVENDANFCMLFDIVYGDGVPGFGCNGWSVHAEVTGYRVWVRCDAAWSELYGLHEWAMVGRGSDRPGDVLREALGIEICRPISPAAGIL